MDQEVFEIDGVYYKRSEERPKDGDEVFCICKNIRPELQTKYGDRGTIDLPYDRAMFPQHNEEFVIFWDQFAKLTPLPLIERI